MRPLSPDHSSRFTTWWLAALSALAIALMHGLSTAHDGGSMTMPVASMSGVAAHGVADHDAAAAVQLVSATPPSSNEATCVAHDDCQIIARSETPLGVPHNVTHELGHSTATAARIPVAAGQVRSRAPCLVSLGISRT